jgi:2-polyprenyl-3-methyl-5-hydroxy-6-metoxy-1,4-benzoquinol methylase
MRPALRADNALELAALRLNLAPVPAAEALFGMPLARSVMAGVRLGVFARLASGPATAGALASELGLAESGARLLLDSLAAMGHVEASDGGRYATSRGSAKWLDPGSKTYVGTYIENCFDYWSWWDQLEDVVRTGDGVEIHEFAPDDPHWRRYIRGQFELARLSAPEVAKALRLPERPRRLLDVAGAHGWFSAELCRRHDELEATVVDLPASAAVGREIIAEAGMSERVRHKEGDAFETELGGPYDGALCFNLIHHFTPERNVELFRRINAALVPGGTFAVLDLFTQSSGKRPDAAAFLGLFFYLTSGAATYSPEELRSWLVQAGFGQPRKVKIRRIPNQTLYEARKT